MEELQWLIQNLKICDGRFTVKCSYKQMHPERDGMLYVKGYQHGTMVKGGTVVTHKCVGAESSKISTFDLQQTKILESSSFSNRKHYSTTLPCENRRNKEPNVIEIKQRIMEKHYKTVSPTSSVLCLETRPFQSRDSCPTTDLVQSIPLRISLILPCSIGLEENEF